MRPPTANGHPRLDGHPNTLAAVSSHHKDHGAGFALTIPAEALRPVIDQAVSAALAAVEAERMQFGNRLAWSEAEAAELLGLEEWNLRDERLRGRIACSRIVGRRIRYTREDLVAYLARSRAEAEK